MPAPTLKMITLDCADVRQLATFWSDLLESEALVVEDEYAMIAGPGAMIGLGRVEGYVPPAWPNPNGSKQFHFDLACEDIGETEARCVELGATVPAEQPGETWRVLLDPAGHPFCLTSAANW
ncbi:VOC family protein [Occultella glacieicola]|nr:VOC family protein [Occultella glacieicola]